MRAVLSTEIRVERVAVFAEMAFVERRPELGLVARAAQASGHLTPAAVQAALPGLTDPGARNVVEWCRTLGLCDHQGGLTRLGEDVAATDDAPVPEQGVYDLWLAEHPLLGRRILSIERLASTRDQRFELIAALPITPDRRVLFRSVLERATRFVLHDLPTSHGQPGCLLRDARTICRLRWTLDFDSQTNQWQLDGFIEKRPIHHEHERDELDLWRLAETWGSGPLTNLGYWQADRRRLAVPLKGLSDKEQDVFHMTRTLPEVEVPGRGAWRDVTVEDLPIGPLNRDEAGRWAHARLDRHLTAHPAYRGRGELRRVFAELTETTPLEEHEPILPAHDAMLTDLRGRPALFWSLAAPVDLAVHPVSAEELGPLQIGVPVRAHASPSPDLLVQVPYRGGWSMRQLVERLLAGTTPRQVLLCDRYVRGPGNLASLELLVRTLRVDRPHLSIEVWTGEQDADIEMIRSLVGQLPRSYRDVFGRNAPHDRYLLVAPATGPGFGWQLSNSPLDVRADVPNPDPATPLRWRGLVAARVTGEQLPEPLCRWLTKGDR